MRLFIYFFIFIFSINSLKAQNGKISGKVVDEKSGIALSNANVKIEGTERTVRTDLNGNFTINNIAPGTYNLQLSYVSYNTKIVDGIVVKANEVSNINVSLVPGIKNNAGDVRVVAPVRVKAVGENIASLLTVQKTSASVLDGVTQQTLKATPTRTAGDAITLVSGASIQDDRFAVIRGLNDRYNASFINGTPLPSTESDRKAFSFDIFPSVILDNLIIYKTATPDKTGDFAGGIIDINTKSTVTKNFYSISIGASYNNLITGKTRYSSENKSKTDFLGLDDGLRAIPNGIPNTIPGTTFAQRAEYAKLFGDYKWGVKRSTAAPNYNFQFTKGYNIERKEKEFFSAILSVNYNKNLSFNKGNRDQFTPDGTIQIVQLNDSVYNEEIVLAGLANFSLKLNNRNSFSWKNNYSVNTDNRLIKRRYTPDLQGDPTAGLRDVVRSYTSNQIFTSQLNGEHLIGNKKTKINWFGAFTQVNRDIPNFSRTSYAVDPTQPDGGGVGNAFVQDLPSQLFGSGTMFFVKSNESIKSMRAEGIQPYTLFKNAQSLKIGGGYQYRERSFKSRLLGFAPYNTAGVQYDYSINQLPEDKIFSLANLGKLANGKGGFMVNEGTANNSNYDASSSISHAFIMSDQRFTKKIRFIYGARVEQFNQKLVSPVSVTSALPPLKIDSTITDVLPSVNFVYSLTGKMNIRLSYAATVNRPEFRELAPFVFYDYLQQYSASGDTRLKRAKIKNYDFRYEFFPGKAQLFSVSAFYKEFTNPIEFMFVPTFFPASQGFYANATSATLKGVEAEFRTLVSTLLGVKNEKSITNRFTLAANAALMETNVKISDTISSFAPSEFRNNDPLQGQSPFVFNGSINYTDEKLGLSTTLGANKIGDRIIAKGTKEIPNLYEKGRTVINFQISKSFMKEKLEIRFNAKDILSQNLVSYYDIDQESNVFSPKKDVLFSKYEAPKTFSFSLTFKF